MNERTAQPKEMGSAFLDLADQGKTRWGTYLIGLFVMACIWLLGSTIFIMLVYSRDFQSGAEPMDGSHPLPDFIALSLTFFALIIGIYVAVCHLHRRPFLSLITPYLTIRWPRLWQGFKWQILFIILATLIEELIFPGTYHYTLDPTQFYKFAILVVLFIPFQAASEEFLFRGYLLQACGHLFRQPIVLITLNGLGFMALHFANPEIEHGLPAWLAYFAWGASSQTTKARHCRPIPSLWRRKFIPGSASYPIFSWPLSCIGYYFAITNRSQFLNRSSISTQKLKKN
jgi:membrane protease YdiL (CAAX protease family)